MCALNVRQYVPDLLARENDWHAPRTFGPFDIIDEGPVAVQLSVGWLLNSFIGIIRPEVEDEIESGPE